MKGEKEGGARGEGEMPDEECKAVEAEENEDRVGEKKKRLERT